jgi:HAD superfamily hydrolase (TIGR01490 family)
MTAPSRLVFTDVDETLIGCKSMFDFLDYYQWGRYGPQGRARAAEVRRTLLMQAAAGVPREDTNRTYFRAWTGEAAADVARWGERWFTERSAESTFYLRATREALLSHRAAGAVIVLVSGSFPALLEPIARDIGARHVLCTMPQERRGELTGLIEGPPVIGTGKRTAVESVLLHYPHIDPADCFGYGDHPSDLPMLAAVGHPVVVGENAELRRLLPRAPQLAAALW